MVSVCGEPQLVVSLKGWGDLMQQNCGRKAEAETKQHHGLVSFLVLSFCHCFSLVIMNQPAQMCTLLPT